MGEEIDQPGWGFATLRQKWLCHAGSSGSALAQCPMQGESVSSASGGTWWCQEPSVRARGCGLYEVTVLARGFVDGSHEASTRVIVSSGSQTHSLDNWHGQDGVTLNGRSALLTLEISYYQSSLADYSGVGEIYNFPRGGNTTPPTNPWSIPSSAAHTQHEPHGWILEARNSEPLTGTTIMSITDVVIYQFAKTP
jgi:hypothetical protein